MPDAAQPPAQPELPSPYNGGKRRGRARRSHTVAKVLLATRADAGHGQRAVGGLPLPPPQRQPQRRRRLRPADQPPGEGRGGGPQGAAQHPGDGLGHPRRRGLRHRQRGRRRLSDTTILFHLSADRESAYGISIPRDSLVDRPDCKTEDGETIPGGSRQMWNAAFALGGPACTIQQFEQITGVRIDNYVVVDFSSFQDMVDAIDGVEVCIPEDIDDPDARHHPRGRHPEASTARRRSTTCGCATASATAATSAGSSASRRSSPRWPAR